MTSQTHPNITFYNVLILPVVDLSAYAHFLSFNFQWQEWRSNPAWKKKTIPPSKSIMKREAVSWLRGWMWRAAFWKNSHFHQTPLAHIQSDAQEIIWDNTAYSRQVCVYVCVCVPKIWLRASVCAALSLRHAQVAHTLNVTLCRCSNEYNGAVCSAWKNKLFGGEFQGITHTSTPKLTLLTAFAITPQTALIFLF